MKRYHPETGELFLPYSYKDGCYRVADPSLGKTRHYSKNQMAVSSMPELIEWVRRGFHVRMRGVDSGQINLVRPEEIELSDVMVVPTGVLAPSGVSNGDLRATTPVKAITTPTGSRFPNHGRIACSRCFGGSTVTWGQTSCDPGNGWRIVNNPMAWGSRTPTIVVLGFSKGGNQNDDIFTRPHNEVAFRGGRANLATILETVGLKPSHRSVDELIAAAQGDFAFGSLVRCSVKRWDGNKWLMSGKDIMSSCLRSREMGTVISNCVSQFLGVLPPSVRLVLMLGNDLKYIEGCYSVIRASRPNTQRINAVAYGDDRVVFAHTVHFKAQGKTIPVWAIGTPGIERRDTDQPYKRELAIEAVSLAMSRKIPWDSKNGMLYHATASTNRESIFARGLVLNPMNDETKESCTGGFFFSSNRPAFSDHIDVWEVNAEGLPLQIDDTDLPLNDDTWWVLYGHAVVEPWRLRLIGNDE